MLCDTFLQVNTVTLFSLWRSSFPTLAPIFRKPEESQGQNNYSPLEIISACLSQTELHQEKIGRSVQNEPLPTQNVKGKNHTDGPKGKGF